MVSRFPSVDGAEEESAEHKHSPFFRTELIETYAPILMSMGMSYDDYWNGDNEAPKWYLKAHKIAKERKDEELWLQGMYIYDALIKVAPMYWFKPQEAQPYPSLPYNASEEKRKAQARAKEIEHHNNNVNNFKNAMAMINKTIGQKKGESDG